MSENPLKEFVENEPLYNELSDFAKSVVRIAFISGQNEGLRHRIKLLKKLKEQVNEKN